MIDIGIINHEKTTLGEMFKKENTKYIIPFFQREYSWTKDDWTDFLEDIKNTAKSDRGHFFGFMAFQRDKGIVFIIEGQQRISTVIILVAVVRDMLKARKHIKWQSIENSYIKTEDELSEDSAATYKLELSEVNRTFFQRFVQDAGTPDEKLSQTQKHRLNLSDQLIYECYKYFYSELSQGLNRLPYTAHSNYLLDIVTVALRKLVVFVIDVEDEIAAYNIFQTLNDRGLDLALADLLKVHLFKKFGKDGWQEAKVKWDEIRSTLSQIKLNTFLRHYWLSCEEVVQEDELLDKFQEKIKTKGDAIKFLGDLKYEAENYEALINPTVDFWGNLETVELLNNLKILSAKMPLPILMTGAWQKNSDFNKLIKMLTAFIFRYVTIAESDNKTLERLLSNISVAMRRDNIKSLQEVKQQLLAEYIDDETFLQQFSKNEMKITKTVKYILQEIETHLSGKQEKFDRTITVEHILPQNPNNEWLTYLEEQSMEKERYIHRIGNMTLLLGRVNQQARNDFFIRKRDKFYSSSAHTRLKLNEWLAKMESWTPEDIEKRQIWLAKQAVSIWKL